MSLKKTLFWSYINFLDSQFTEYSQISMKKRRVNYTFYRD